MHVIFTQTKQGLRDLDLYMVRETYCPTFIYNDRNRTIRSFYNDRHRTRPFYQMNNYIVRSYRDVIVITKFAITKFATRRASKDRNRLRPFYNYRNIIMPFYNHRNKVMRFYNDRNRIMSSY